MHGLMEKSHILTPCESMMGCNGGMGERRRGIGTFLMGKGQIRRQNEGGEVPYTFVALVFGCICLPSPSLSSVLHQQNIWQRSNKIHMEGRGFPQCKVMEFPLH